jgi:hypothetical protein
VTDGILVADGASVQSSYVSTFATGSPTKHCWKQKVFVGTRCRVETQNLPERRAALFRINSSKSYFAICMQFSARPVGAGFQMVQSWCVFDGLSNAGIPREHVQDRLYMVSTGAERDNKSSR